MNFRISFEIFGKHNNLSLHWSKHWFFGVHLQLWSVRLFELSRGGIDMKPFWRFVLFGKLWVINKYRKR